MAKLGLVTVLFNSNSVLEGFLKSIGSQKFTDYHLYLVDNTSNAVTDKLIAYLCETYNITNYTHIKNEGNEGVAKGNNQGIELSIKDESTHTLLLNNDIEFYQPELLSGMLAYMESKNESFLIPKIYFYDNKKVWMAGGKFLNIRGATIHVGEGREDGPAFNKEKYFDYAPTCFMLINNTVFSDVGIMDEKYFVYYDDTDFVYRAYKKGYRIKLLPQYHVYHKVSSLTGGNESLFSIYYGNRNRVYFIGKNLKGLGYITTMLFTMASRVFKYIRYDKKQREKLLSGLNDGFALLK
jgi:GT2 family glycosyltransferase